MKRIVSGIVAVMITLTLSLGVFAACDWITVNNDRDLAQTVATVKIDEKIDAQDITKKELKARYMSYEYQYVYYYSYTEAAAYEAALKNLVQNRVIIQKARLDLAAAYNDARTKNEGLDETMTYFKANALAGNNDINPANGEVTVNSMAAEGLVQYLTEYEYYEAYYNVRKSINSMIDNYDESEDDEDEHEDVSYTDRTAPETDSHSDLTEAELKETAPTYQERLAVSATLEDAFDETKYPTLYALNLALYKAYKIDVTSSTERTKAYNSMIESFKKIGFISESEGVLKSGEEDPEYSYKENADNVIKYSYYRNLLRSQMEATIVAKYEDSLITGTQAGLDENAIWNQYVLDYEAQRAKYKNDYSSYETALDSASDTSLVLYNPYENYGYVANILIGFTDEQRAILTAKKAEDNVTDAAIEAERALLAQDIDAYDQRSSWVYSNHGTYENGTFDFEDVYVVNGKNDALNATLSSFIGTVSVKDEAGYTVKDDNDAEVTKWLFTDVTATAISFNDFAADYLTAIGIDGTIFVDGDDSTVKFMTGYTGAANVTELEELDKDSVDQLTFAFSTDPGILSKTYGYLYSPYTSASQYVSEFAAAAKALVEKGVGAYTTVLTDYGYHVMICTKVVKDEYNVTTDKAKFIADLSVEGTLAYKYKEVKYDSLTSTQINRSISTFIKETTAEGSSAVTYYEKNYKDLVTETSAS